MVRNIGSLDRLIRIVMGVILVAAAFIVGISSAAGIVLLVVGIVALATAAVRTCPLYLPFGISTDRKS